MIESMMSHDPQNRPTVQMCIEATEMLINLHQQSMASQEQEARPLEDELDNRYQFMLIQKD